ncbi:MAG: ABC transporter substrate-binding protein [Spirochaetales bacterium]|nr:ABC transporter substrate-binding protein [Spirochaetales bacterium]
MKKKICCLLLVFSSLSLFAAVDYATNFDIIDSGSGYLLRFGGNEFSFSYEAANHSGYSRCVVMGTVYSAMFEALASERLIAGIDTVRYTSSQKIQALVREAKVVEVAPSGILDLEKTLIVNPDCLIAPQGFAVSENVELLSLSGIDLFFFMDWLETHPLGRLEWIKVVGLMIGRFDIACDYFDSVVDSYLEIHSLAKQEILQSPRILVNIPYFGVWYIPGEKNYFAQFIRDANGIMFTPEPGNSLSSSLAMDPEVIVAKASDCDFWLINSSLHKGQGLSSLDFPYRSFFKAFENGLVFNNDKNVKGEGLDFFELGVVRPDLVLRDLYLIFKNRDDADCRFFRRM